MEPSKEAIAVRITRLNRQILGKVTSGSNKLKKNIDREALLDALTVLYDECNDDPTKKCDELVRVFVDKYRSTLAELRRVRVCISDFDVLQTIGRGHFGDVHMVREKHTGDVYALKCVRKEAARKRAAGAPEDEREVLASAASPWMPKLQYAFQDSNSLYLVMELCSGGDLAGLLSRRHSPLSERDAAFYVAEVAHALKALHAMGFVHRDVKPHNILLDRCGHVKLGDFGSCARLSDRTPSSMPVGTPDYVSPELLAAAACAARHAVCLASCRGVATTAISACDYWSLGVVAFELVTLQRPFSTGEDDSITVILGNIQKYESDPLSEPPFSPHPDGPSAEWRALVRGLLCVAPARRYNYLDTLQHAALQHIASHHIRDQPPPWVPCTRGPEDPSYFSPAPRAPPPPDAAPFRARAPFAGQLPFVGYSYIAPDDNDDSYGGGFNASHDCTAIDLATFKSAEKIVAMRGREIASLQGKLAAAEAAVGAEVERVRREAEGEAERQRARLQADITALSLQNRRLERQIEVEKEERMALERTNQQLSTAITDRTNAELRTTLATVAGLEIERDSLKAETRRLEAKLSELQTQCAQAVTAAETARSQQRHYKDIIEHVQELRHRRLTEINVKAIDTIAKERALRRQTLNGGEAESRETGARVAQAEAAVARETRARGQAEKRLLDLEADHARVQTLLDSVTRQLDSTKETLNEKCRVAETTTKQVKDLQTALAHEKVRVSSLMEQAKEQERSIKEAASREAALEEQYTRTETRLHERIEGAEARAATALSDDARHREKVATLEQLVRQLEREVTALESRVCPHCESRDKASDTESVGDNRSARDKHDKACDKATVTEGGHNREQGQVALLKEQLERAESQLQARAEELATLRQECRTANLARWRKEREYNELSVEAKSSAREVKRLEERLTHAIEARKTAEQKAQALQSEIVTLKPQHEQASKELGRVKEQLAKLQKEHETAQAEVDRSRNDIRKLKSELQYSEKRRLHAEEQEEISSRERVTLRDELHALRASSAALELNNKALQETCTILEDQLTDMEQLADMHEDKNKELKSESSQYRSELETCQTRLAEMELKATSFSQIAGETRREADEARDKAHHAFEQLQILKERLENQDARVVELEARTVSVEGERLAAEAALANQARRVRDLHEECAQLRTRAHDHHTTALQLQARLQETQEELCASREAQEAATAWWRTRETKAECTLRQQAKLIDFLQAKVEEASTKKCSLGEKLFGRSRSRKIDMPLRRFNRELRDEVDRLRTKLASPMINSDNPYATPRKNMSRQTPVTNGSMNNLETPKNGRDNSVQILWSDGSRESVHGRISSGALVLTCGDREWRARLRSLEAPSVPQNEAARSFEVTLDSSEKGRDAAIVCPNITERAHWISALSPPSPAGYTPRVLRATKEMPNAALQVATNVVAIGCTDGLYSLRSPITVQFASDVSPPRTSDVSIQGLAAVSGRALIISGGALLHTSLISLESALRRASNLKPTVSVTKVCLPDASPPHLVRALIGEATDNHCAAVACSRRVYLLRYAADAAEFKIVRSLTVDRQPCSLLLSHKTLYIAGEKPLKINLPSGALETFGIDEPIIAAAARKHSPPKAILLIRDDPAEILLCYAECGVFVDATGKRTRNEDPKWSSAVQSWEYVAPFLYVIGEEKVTIIYIDEEAYRTPPCTCDATSLASSASECYMPEIFNLKMKEPALLGVVVNAIVVRTKLDNGYNVSVVEGMAAFRSVGGSVESLETISDTNTISSSGDVCEKRQSLPDETPYNNQMPQDVSQESVEPHTRFLADIKNRAKQLREKNRLDQASDDVIKHILTTEVGLKQMSNGRMSPVTTSEFDSDSEGESTEDGSETTKQTADLCAEMFTRQVRFQ